MRLTFERAYEAVINNEQFIGILDEVAALIHAKGYAAGWAAHDLIESMFAIKNDWSPEMVADYHTHYASTDPWAAAVLAAGKSGAFLNLSNLVPESQFATSALYNELLREGGDDTFYAAGMAIALPDNAAGGLTFYRGRNQNAFDIEDMRILRAIEQDLTRLIVLKAKLNGQAICNGHWREMVTRLSVPAFVLNAALILVDHNIAAEQVLQHGAGLALRQGRLTAVLPRSQTELEQTCRAVLHGSLRDVGTFQVACGEIVRRFTVLALPNPGGGRRILLLGDQPRDIDREHEFLLRQRYRLSPAEAAIMCAFASGRTTKEISELRSVGVETVRTQYRSAMVKMKCHTLTEAIIAVREVPMIR